MKINWAIRMKNPTWWAQIIAAIVMPLVVGMGYEWSDMTSWATLWQTLATALGNPVVVATMLTSLWAAITDPTTSGTFDSKSALERTELKGNYKKEA